MTNHFIPIEHLRSRCKAKFREFGMCDKQIDSYGRNFHHIIDFMETHSYKEYTHDVCDAYVRYLQEESAMKYSAKQLDMTTMRLINLVLDNLPYNALRAPSKVSHEMPDTEFGRLAQGYYDNLIENGQLRMASVLQYKYYLSYLAIAMKLDGVETKDLNRTYIFTYLKGEPVLTTRKVSVIKMFLRYLYESGHTQQDLSLALKGYKMPRSEKVISYYTPEEVLQIEQSIDRSTKYGKRNYAIVQLASRLGLRSSDICQLKFSNIDWDACLVNLKQYKTSRKITLPLLDDTY